MTALLQGQPVVKQAYDKFQQFNRDERLRALDEAHQRYLHDLATDIEAAHEKGKGEGRAEGKAEGKAERDIEIARNLIQMDISTDRIVQATGLSLAEVNRLSQEVQLKQKKERIATTQSPK